jgi:hypothetical protein
MNPKSPPLLKWYDPGPLAEPEHIREMMEELDYRLLFPEQDEGI